MADLAMIKEQITRIRQQLPASPAFAAGRPNDDSKAEAEEQRLTRLKDTVLIIIRELKSSESLIRVREDALKKVPPAQKWPAEQSLRQLRSNVKSVLDEAEKLKSDVIDLLVKNGVLNPAQRAKAFIDLMENLEKAAGAEAQAQVAHLLHPTTISAPQPGSLTLTSAASVIAFVYLGLSAVKRKMESRARTAK